MGDQRTHEPARTPARAKAKAPAAPRRAPTIQTSPIRRSLSQRADPLEQEAERSAAQLGSQPARTSMPGGGSRSQPRPLPDDLPSGVGRALRSPGQPLPLPIRALMEAHFRHDFSGVRLHNDAEAQHSARAINANAYTVGEHVAFRGGQYDPASPRGQRLIAHELAHVVQQADRPTPAVQRDEPIEIELISSVTEYTSPRTGITHKLGEAAGPSILNRIDSYSGGSVIFHWFNFNLGHEQTGSIADWEILQFASGIAGTSTEFEKLGKQLSPAQWQALAENPTAELLKRYEAGTIDLSDEAVLTTYKGMINREAEERLDENEKAIDSILDAPDRVAQFKEYASGLLEASRIRDALEYRRDEIKHSLVQQQSFTFGYAGNFINMNPYQRLQVFRQLAPVEDTIKWCYRSFPLLSRLRTHDISPGRVEFTLKEIKANIIATRAELALSTADEGSLDRMNMLPIRQRVDTQLGTRASEVVAAEDRSRSRWNWFKTIGTLAVMVGVLFLPGGVFLDAAIGLAIAAD